MRQKMIFFDAHYDVELRIDLLIEKDVDVLLW